jgi:ActR/RegA family two-component response regulator
LDNVRAIRPMRILLVTDDGRYADDIATAATLRGVNLARVAVGDDLDAAARLRRPNIVVLDADNKIARTSRTATVFAALHPRIATVIVAERAPERIAGNVQVVDKRRSAERLLGDLEHALLGLGAPVEEHRRVSQ